MRAVRHGGGAGGVADAGAPTVEPERLGVAVASGIGGIASIIDGYNTMREKGWQRMSPFTVPMLMTQRLGRVDRDRSDRPSRGTHPGQRLRVRR